MSAENTAGLGTGLGTGPGTGLARGDIYRSLAAVTSSAFGVGISFGIGYPLVSLVFEEWAQPRWVIGLGGAVPSVAILILLPFMPRVLARLGTVPAMILGCLISAIGFAGLFLFQSVPAWIALRFAMSGGLTLPWLIGETWLNTVTTDETRGRVVALYAAGFFLGFAVGPLLLQWTGTSGPLPFLFGALSSIIAIVPIILGKRLAPSMQDQKSTGVFRAFNLAPIAMAVAFLGGVLEMSHFALLANVAISSGVSTERALEFLTVLLVGGLTLQVVIGWMADKAPRVGVSVALALAYVALAMALPELLTSPTFSVPVVFVLGGIVIGFYTLGLVMIGEQVDPGELAIANAAFIMMYQVGGILGPAIAGFAMTYEPVYGFTAVMIGFTIEAVLFAALLRVNRWRKR
jgi:MFS family permease